MGVFVQAALQAQAAMLYGTVDGKIERGAVIAGHISVDAHPVEMKRLIGSATVASGSAQNRHRTRSKPSVAISDPRPASRRRPASSSGHPRWLWLASVTPAYVRTSEICRP